MLCWKHGACGLTSCVVSEMRELGGMFAKVNVEATLKPKQKKRSFILPSLISRELNNFFIFEIWVEINILFLDSFNVVVGKLQKIL